MSTRSLALATLLAAAFGLPCRSADPSPSVKDREPAGSAAEGQRRKSSTSIAHIHLAGRIPEGVGQGGMLADVRPHLHRIVERIDKAAKDDRVKGLLLSIDGPNLGRARADEIRAAIGRLRKAGKPVAAHLVSGDPVHYAVALACDSIAMPPAATLEITGVRAEMTFFKSMLDRLGVQAEILQVGDFKGAAEPLTRDGMSPQLRQQYESWIGDLYEQLVDGIAVGRGLPAARVRELVDIGVFTPGAAAEAKLIDAVAYEDAVFADLARRSEAEAPRLARDYGERKLDKDFSGVGGLVKLVEMLSGQGQDRPAGKGKRVAIIHVSGAIQGGEGKDDLFGGGTAGSDTVIEAIRDAEKNDDVAAIVLRIDSPGGSALASDLIWREAERARKPVVASLSDIAASGGYYIAVAADRVVAAPGTLTGSIGVVGGKMVIGKGLEKIGVSTDVVSKGRNAGWLSGRKPFTEAEKEAFLGSMKDVYLLFTTKVAAGRKLDMEKVAALAEGRVFTGRMAKEAGLVDRLGTLEDAIDEARSLAGLPANEPLERMLLPEPRGLFDDLFGATQGGTTPAVAAIAADPLAALRETIKVRIAAIPGLAGLVRDSESLALIGSGRPLFMLPLRIDLR
ncbi:MAG: signal peptide peptidase SppA [Planctomycetia bacterium]